MAEATQYVFDFKELAAMMVKDQGLREGFWSVYVKFGISAANISLNEGPHHPTAVVPLLEVGIIRETEPGPLAVNAAEVNRAPGAAKKDASKKGAQ